MFTKFERYELPEDLKNYLIRIIDKTTESWLPIHPNEPGEAILFKFDNGYGASIIKKWGSYGYENDLYELALISFNDGIDNVTEYVLVYTELVNFDVLGHLTFDDVVKVLRQIKIGNINDDSVLDELSNW